ncbi:MAG: HAMP domain-containing protein [bacterium]|nr:HAMP domain-containing protein [bacterium]
MKTVKRMEDIQSLTELAVQTSALIHETQKERGYTVGFLKSGGTVFTTELPNQRKSTDTKATALREFLADFDLSSHGPEVQGQFEDGLARLEKIQANRSAISSRSMKTGDAIRYYTGMHKLFLSSIAAMAHRSEDAGLAQSLTSFAIFLEGKERGGIERALMSGALATNSMEGAALKKLAEIVARQHEYFATFQRTSTPKEYDIFETAMSKPAAKVAEDMVQDTFALALSVEDPSNLGSELSAPTWFEASTSRLGLLKEIERGLAAHLIADANSIQEQASASMTFNGGLGILSIILVAAAGLWIFRSIMYRVRGLVDSIDRVDKQHDLSLRIDDQTHDELSSVSASFDKLVGSLQDILRSVDGVSTSLSEDASQVGSSSQSLAVGATQQAANLQSISTQVGSILEQIKRNTDSAQSATSLAHTSETSACKGMEHMNIMGTAMDEIAASSDRISDIIKTIDELAFQTNLLALNANVEAARAGEAGRGFAVVAEEVRSLAQRSAEAARNTASVITESTQCAQRGVSIAAQASVALSEISQSTNQVNSLLGEIAKASEDQTDAIASVNQGISELDEVTQYNAAHSEELAAAADQTASECKHLARLVSQFKLEASESDKVSAPVIVQQNKAPSSSTGSCEKPDSNTPSPPSIAPTEPASLATATYDQCESFDDADFDSQLDTF